MKNQLIKDLPLYLNGFAVTYLFYRAEIDYISIIMYIICVLSFFQYGKNKKL